MGVNFRLPHLNSSPVPNGWIYRHLNDAATNLRRLSFTSLVPRALRLEIQARELGCVLLWCKRYCISNPRREKRYWLKIRRFYFEKIVRPIGKMILPLPKKHIEYISKTDIIKCVRTTWLGSTRPTELLSLANSDVAILTKAMGTRMLTLTKKFIYICNCRLKKIDRDYIQRNLSTNFRISHDIAYEWSPLNCSEIRRRQHKLHVIRKSQKYLFLELRLLTAVIAVEPAGKSFFCLRQLEDETDASTQWKMIYYNQKITTNRSF